MLPHWKQVVGDRDADSVGRVSGDYRESFERLSNEAVCAVPFLVTVFAAYAARVLQRPEHNGLHIHG